MTERPPARTVVVVLMSISCRAWMGMRITRRASRRGRPCIRYRRGSRWWSAWRTSLRSSGWCRSRGAGRSRCSRAGDLAWMARSGLRRAVGIDHRPRAGAHSAGGGHLASAVGIDGGALAGAYSAAGGGHLRSPVRGVGQPFGSMHGPWPAATLVIVSIFRSRPRLPTAVGIDRRSRSGGRAECPLPADETNGAGASFQSCDGPPGHRVRPRRGGMNAWSDVSLFLCVSA
jgi:hypothetical protein